MPVYGSAISGITSFATMVRLDRRGTGLSDRPRGVPTLETRMDDVRAVMNAAGIERAALMATFEAAPMALLYAATYPERIAALVLFNPYAKAVWSEDYPWGRTDEEGRRDAIGEIGDDAGGRTRRKRSIVDLPRVGGDDVEPAWIEGGDVGERSEAALVLLDGDDARRSF